MFLRGLFKIMSSHLVTIKPPALGSSHDERRASVGGDADGFVKTAFGRGIIVAHAIGCAHVQQERGIGGILPAGLLHDFEVLVIILPPPGFQRSLAQTRQSAVGNHAHAFHYWPKAYLRAYFSSKELQTSAASDLISAS